MALFVIHKIGETLCPGIFKFYKDFYEFQIILELGIDHLNILLVLFQQLPKILESLFYLLCQNSNGFGLVGADSSENALSSQQNVVAEIVSTHAFGVCDGIDFAQDLNKLCPFADVFRSIYDNSPPGLFLLFNQTEILFRHNSFSYKPSCVSLNQHEFKNINLLICNPCMIKFEEVLAHVIQNVLHSYIDLLHYLLVDISYDLLNHFELLEKLASGFQNILREYIFLAVDPQIRKTFLCRVQNFREVAQTSLLVQNLISFGKLVAVLSGGTFSFKTFTKSLYLVKKTFAGSLSIF